MEELVQAKKHFSRMGWAYAAATVLITLVQIGFIKLLRQAAPQVLNRMSGQLLVSAVSMYLVGFPVLFLLLKKGVPAERVEKHRMKAGQYVASVVMCFGLAYAANIAGNVLTGLIGRYTGHNVQNQLQVMVSDLSPWVILLYMVILAPIAEELVFRKLIVDRAARYGQGVAVVVSGLMFGLFHGNLNQFVYAAAIGMFLAFLYVKTGSLKVTISIHMLFNFVGGFLSTQVFRLIDLNVLDSDDYEVILNSVQENLFGWLMLALFGLFVLSMLIAGTILFIVSAVKKRFACEDGTVYVPRQLRLNLALANSGMLLFFLIWIVTILRQLLA